MHINGEVKRSCTIPVGSVKSSDKIVTIEGLSATSSHPVQKAWAAPHLPLASKTAAAQGVSSGAEVNAWVVVKPDNTCMIRIARSEMGQGTETGLAQLVARSRTVSLPRSTVN